MGSNQKLDSLVHYVLDGIHEQKDEVRTELQSAYKSLKNAKGALKGKGKKNAELKELKKGMRKLADELDEMEDTSTTEMEEAEVTEIEERNEKSEGYGTFKGLGMKESTKVIKLKQSDLKRVINKVIKEQNDVGDNKLACVQEYIPETENLESLHPACIEVLHDMFSGGGTLTKDELYDQLLSCKRGLHDANTGEDINSWNILSAMYDNREDIEECWQRG